MKKKTKRKKQVTKEMQLLIVHGRVAPLDQGAGLGLFVNPGQDRSHLNINPDLDPHLSIDQGHHLHQSVDQGRHHRQSVDLIHDHRQSIDHGHHQKIDQDPHQSAGPDHGHNHPNAGLDLGLSQCRSVSRGRGHNQCGGPGLYQAHTAAQPLPVLVAVEVLVNRLTLQIVYFL